MLLLHIKDRIDADRRPGRLLLIGSQSFALMKGVSQSLAGRVRLPQPVKGSARFAKSPGNDLDRYHQPAGHNQRENEQRKQLVAELALKNRVLKKSAVGRESDAWED